MHHPVQCRERGLITEGGKQYPASGHRSSAGHARRSPIQTSYRTSEQRKSGPARGGLPAQRENDQATSRKQRSEQPVSLISVRPTTSY